MKAIELLAPAGSWDALRVAVFQGADAVYLGGSRFGARASAQNFSDEEMIKAIAFCHFHQVKVYVTVNTVIYDDEMADALKYIEFLYLNDVDAIIVQDLGLMTLVRKHFPDLEVHASTQMTVTNLDAVKFLASQGVKRVVLSRELPIEEIKAINDQIDIETEVFVHGALCVCYSGQCYMSGLIGGRSGNRGRCAQPCRKKYSLQRNHLLEQKNLYLISPRDLCTIDHVGELIEAGVTSFKVEGRLKGPVYVGTVIRAYRQAIDQYLQQSNEKLQKSALNLVFNRGYTKGFLFGAKGNDFVNMEYNSHRGVFLGEVVKYEANKVTIKLVDTLNLQDYIAFDGGDSIECSKIMCGKQIITSANKGDWVTLDVKRPIKVGTKVYKTHDARLNEVLNLQTSGLYPVSMSITLKVGQHPTLTIKDEQNHEVTTSVMYQITEASSIPLTTETLYKQLSKLNDTSFYLKHLDAERDENIFVPLGVINQLRRQAIEALTETRCHWYNRTSNASSIQSFPQSNQSCGKVSLNVSVRTKEQLQVALRMPVENIYVDGALMKDLGPTERELIVTTHRVIRNYQASQGAQMISNLGDLYCLSSTDHKVYSNFNFNITNSNAISFLIEQGVQQVTLSYEMNCEHLRQLRYPNKNKLELIVYGRQEAMITKHCVYKANCRRQCQSENELVDALNEVFPIYMDDDCHMHILNSKILILNDELDEIIKQGYQHFRLQFTVEDAAMTERVISAYCAKLFAGHNTALSTIQDEMKKHQQFTRGYYNKEIL